MQERSVHTHLQLQPTGVGLARKPYVLRGGILRAKCKCGWTIAADIGRRIKCGQCGLESVMTEDAATPVKPSYIQLGDCVAFIAKWTGVEAIANYMAGGKCSPCERRRAALNRIGKRKRQ